MMSNSTKTISGRLARVVHGLFLSLAFLPAMLSLDVRAAQISGALMSNYAASPISAVAQITPLVMLSMSRDHQYFFKGL
jgi:hypothetical protein